VQLTSTFTAGEVQADGRFYVRETHTASNGQVIQPEYLCDGTLDPQLVLEERAKVIVATLRAREAARLAVVGTEVPWTKFEYLERFTPAERLAVRARAKADPVVEDFMELMNASGGIYPSLARPGLQYLASVGILSFDRATEIGGGA